MEDRKWPEPGTRMRDRAPGKRTWAGFVIQLRPAARDVSRVASRVRCRTGHGMPCRYKTSCDPRPFALAFLCRGTIYRARRGCLARGCPSSNEFVGARHAVPGSRTWRDFAIPRWMRRERSVCSVGLPGRAAHVTRAGKLRNRRDVGPSGFRGTTAPSSRRGHFPLPGFRVFCNLGVLRSV